jgi:hypothetical protein
MPPRNVPITQRKLADLHCEVLKHNAYSPDLAPSDYRLFPNMKKDLNGTKFLSTEDAADVCNQTFSILSAWFKEVGALE